MNETVRLQALANYDILDTPPEKSFDDVAALAARLCDTPIAMVTFVDEHRQWFKAAVGLSFRETPRDIACCGYTIEGTEVFVVPDTTKDPRFAHASFVADEPKVRFYAGAPLISAEGHAVGAVAVMDTVPRELSSGQTEALQSLANLAAAQLELRRKAQSFRTTAEEKSEAASGFRQLINAIPHSLWITDANGGLKYVNQQSVDYSGLTEEELLGSGWLKAVHPDDVARTVEIWNASIEQMTPYEIEYRMRRVDGQYRWVLARGLPIRDDSGKVLRWAGTCTDIDEQRRDKERIREQAAMLANAHDAIISKSLRGEVLYWNRGAEQMFGWRAEEVLGKKTEDFLYKDLVKLAEARRKLIAEGRWSGEMVKRSKGGRELVVQCSWTLLTDDAGQPKSVLSINTDVTERNKLEVQFLRAQRMESIGTLAGGIAHDLNNALAPVLMSMDLLRMGITDPADLELLETISTSAQRGAKMVQQLLAFARGIDGDRASVDLAALITQVAKIAEDTFPKDIRIQKSISAELPVISADATQLHQVLLNLCVNARDAMPNGGTLKLSAKPIVFDEHYASMNLEAKVGRYVNIVVEDSGTGIPQEIIEKIFDPFFTTKEVGKGTGLGLSTSLAIVKSHGGFLRVYSELGRGTKFRVYLPALASEAPVATQETEAKLPIGNGEVILVVDDEELIRQVTRKTLEKHGYQVLLAADGAEALAVYASHKEIAVVLTDIMMPVLDGPSMIRALMRMDPKVRVIAASGLSSNANTAKAAGAGVKHFLPKPYMAEVLLKMLAEILHGT